MNIDEYESRLSEDYLESKHRHLIEIIKTKGVYVFGTGLLGKFAVKQIIENSYNFLGFADNNPKLWGDNIISPELLPKDAGVIIASIYYFDIGNQLDSLGISNYAYYEELALALDGFEVYYQGFKGIFRELECNKTIYSAIKNLLEDDLSKEVFDLLIKYRMELKTEYVHDAFLLSQKQGEQDFDNVIVSRLNDVEMFFDVGGCDGYTTSRFIEFCPNYKRIYYFEPNSELMRISKERLKKNKNIEFIEAGVGNENAEGFYSPITVGAGVINENGEIPVKLVKLDDFISDGNCYVKMDIEGSEYQAICGMENAIRKYMPMLGISVYHLPGDIHKLINLVLSYNNGYRVFLRHYTNAYADTIAYFV